MTTVTAVEAARPVKVRTSHNLPRSPVSLLLLSSPLPSSLYTRLSKYGILLGGRKPDPRRSVASRFTHTISIDLILRTASASAVYQSVRDDKNPTNWLLVNYEVCTTSPYLRKLIES